MNLRPITEDDLHAYVDHALAPERRAEVADYLENGVRYVWILDPKSKKATVYTEMESYEVTSGSLRTQNPTIEIPLSEIFD